MSSRLSRSEVPLEATWRLEDLFDTEEQWLLEMKAILAALPTVTCYKGKLKDSPYTLLHCLEAMEKLQVRAQQCNSYAHLRLTEDSTNGVSQGNNSRAQDMVTTLSTSLSFIASEISAYSEEELASYMEEEPKLQEFQPFLQQLMMMKPYRLSPDTEATLAALQVVLQAPYKIYNQFKLADMKFESITDSDGNEHALSFALYENKYVHAQDTQLRRAAFRSFTHTLRSYNNGLADTYATEVKKQVVMAKLRGYGSVTEMLLHPQQASIEMYHTVLDTIQDELAPHMRKWASLKQRILGLEELRYSDLKATIDSEYDPKISFEEAADSVERALQVMGKEYTTIIHDAIHQRWIDYADNVGKSTGAFCSSLYGKHSYILMTWTGSMRGAFTLAHELGHAGHFMLAGNHQRMTSMRPSLYFIEAPSTLNELLLGDYLFRQSDDLRMRRWLISQLLNTYYHNFVTHLLEGEMQRRVYELATLGEPLNAKLLNELKGKILREFWGDSAVIDEGAELTWMRQPHYYLSLYPYTYAAGLAASTAAARRIREQGQPAVDQWLTALKAGGTLPPLELMKLAGVDMLDVQTIKSAVAYVGELVDELVSLYES